MTREKVKVISRGLTADSTLVSGRLGNKTASEPTLARRELRERVSGKLAERSDGLITLRTTIMNEKYYKTYERDLLALLIL